MASEKWRPVHTERREIYPGSKKTVIVFVEAVTCKELSTEELLARYNDMVVDRFYAAEPAPDARP